MMRLASALVMGAAILSACRPTADDVTAEQCPAWRNIDFAGLPTHLNDDPQDPLLEDVWENWANEETGIVWSTDAPISTVHFITSPGGLTTDPMVREVIGRQAPSGWEIYARSTPSHPPWQPQWTGWRRVILTAQGQRKLNSTLADPCVWVAPAFWMGQFAS